MRRSLCVSGFAFILLIGVSNALSVESDAKDLSSENAKLKAALTAANERIDILTAELGRLVLENARLRTGPGTPVKPTAVPIEQARQRVDELGAKIAELRPLLKLAMDKVTALIRSSVDVNMVPPSFGKIEHGQVYRRDAVNRGSAEYPSWRYYYVPIGPAVKVGDFRTDHDRTRAIQAAEQEAAPLKLQMAQLRTDLERAVQELKAAQIGAQK